MQVFPQQVTYIQKTWFALWTDVTHSILVTIRAVIAPVVVSTITCIFQESCLLTAQCYWNVMTQHVIRF